MKFRQDINILRGISILLVTVFHFFPKLLPYGYLGVDVFFILSGFLISLGILNDKKDNRFSYVSFYQRRVHRIIPAVLAMLLLVTIVELFILLPTDLIKFSSSVQATLAFISNIFFFLTGGYFGGTDAVKPLLHMWSLSIEEQFYILFPVLFVLSLKLIKNTKYLISFVMLMLVSSYLLNIYLHSIGGENAAFFLLPTRVWQFLVGTLAAILLYMRGGATLNYKYVSLFGLALIVASNFFVFKLIPDASIISLGVFLIIVNSLRVSKNILTDFVGFLGRISFSLYLWHWPIAAFLNYYNITDIPLWQSVLGMIVSTLMGYLSWQYVEERFRKPVNTKKLLTKIGIIYLILIGVSQWIISAKGLPNRYPQAVNEIAAAVDSNFRCPKVGTFLYGGSKACYININGETTAQTAILGNSHALMYAPVIAQAYQKSILVVPLNACTPTYDININTVCRKQFEQNLDAIIKDTQIKNVVVGTTWERDKMVDGNGTPVSNGHETFNNSLLKTVQKLESVNKNVYVIGPIALPSDAIAADLSRSLIFNKDVSHIKQSAPANEFLTVYADDMTFWKKQLGNRFIPTYSALCDDQRCYFRKDGKTYFSDDNHLSQAGAAMTLPVFKKALQP